jgi:hypothetical protein
MTVDWGDGTPVEQFNYGAGITAFNETHQYLDDDPTGTVSDLYSATVTITDSTNLIDSGLLGVTVNNVAPQLTNLLATPLVISETDTITLTGVISDPGTLDTFSLTIDWQDGSVENFNYPAGTTNFLVTHSYQDDALLAFAPLADFTIDLTIADDDSGSRSTSLLVMVNNVAPELLGVTATSIPENDSTLLSGLINEVSPLDTFTLTVDWGDGTALESFNYPAGTTIFSETHPYLDDDPTGTPADLYTVTLMLEDDNGGVDILQTTLTVSNVAPVVDAGPDQAVLRGAPLSFSGTFSDVGILDTHTILWGFGDGGTSTGTLTPIYTYTEGGTYTVTLTVTDDDTGVGTDTLVVTVEMPTSVGLSGVGGQSSRSLSVTGPLLLVLAFSMFLLRRRYLATGYWPRNRLPSIGQ